MSNNQTLVDNPSLVVAGSHLKNNETGDIITVNSVSTVGGFVAYRARTRAARIAFHRIFTDGRDRKQGYNLLPVGATD